jgi:hypothetical protein
MNHGLSRAIGLASLLAALATAASSLAADPAKPPPQAPAAPPSAAPSIPPSAAPSTPPAAAPPAAPTAETPAAPEETPAPIGDELKGSSKPSKYTWPQARSSNPSDIPGPILPRRIEYEDGDPILPDYTLTTKPDRALVTGGLVTFVVPYSLSSIVGLAALTSNSTGNTITALLVPVAGPFITVATIQGQYQPGPPPDRIATYFLLIDGFTQLAGAAMFTAGMLVPEKYLERTAKLPGKPEILVGGKAAAIRFHF